MLLPDNQPVLTVVVVMDDPKVNVRRHSRVPTSLAKYLTESVKMVRRAGSQEID